jgi:hypothetical protein
VILWVVLLSVGVYYGLAKAFSEELGAYGVKDRTRKGIVG